jgi:hypothetical protein
MTADNHILPPGPTDSSEAWRRTFIIAINQLAGGEASHLKVTDWAIRAQARQGHRNPVEVAHEEWASGNLPGSA